MTINLSDPKSLVSSGFDRTPLSYLLEPNRLKKQTNKQWNGASDTSDSAEYTQGI